MIESFGESRFTGERNFVTGILVQVEVVRAGPGISPVVIQAGNIGQVYYFQLFFWFLGIALFQIETLSGCPFYFKETFKKKCKQT
jgi:hypothetical protein